MTKKPLATQASSKIDSSFAEALSKIQGEGSGKSQDKSGDGQDDAGDKGKKPDGSGDKRKPRQSSDQSTDQSSFSDALDEILNPGKKDGEKSKNPDDKKDPEDGDKGDGAVDDDVAVDFEVSPKIGQKFTEFKTKLKDSKTKLAETETKLAEAIKKITDLESGTAKKPEIKIDELPEVIEMKKKIDAYESQLEAVNIESSPKFKEKYDAQLDRIANKSIIPLFSAIKDEDEKRKVSEGITKVLGSIPANEESEGLFIAALDDVLEDSDISQTLKTRITSAVSLWREKFVERGKALADHKATKAEIDKATISDQASSASEAVSVFDQMHAQYEAENAVQLTAFRSNEAAIKYDAITKPLLKEVRESIELSFRTGKPSPAMIHYAMNGASAAFVAHQSKMLAEAFMKLQSEHEELKKKFAKNDDADPMGGEKGGGGKGKSGEKKGSGFGMLDTLDEMLSGQGK